MSEHTAEPLKLCPFCGCAAKYNHDHRRHSNTDVYQVFCMNCGVSYDHVNSWDAKILDRDVDEDKIKSQLFERWNTRQDHIEGVDDPDYFIKSIKREVETILHDNALMLESNNKGEELLSQAVINTIAGNNQRIAFILDQFPKDQS